LKGVLAVITVAEATTETAVGVATTVATVALEVLVA
jgi:hypothetical protein